MIKEHLSGGAKFDQNFIKTKLEKCFHEEILMYACHPFNQLVGVEEVLKIFYEPLSRSFDEPQRVPSILIRAEVEGEIWLSIKGSYQGVFKKEWLDIPPTNEKIKLDYGEFHRLKQGKIIESKTLLNILGLMKQAEMISGERLGEGPTPYRPEGKSIHLIDGSFHALLSWVKGKYQKKDIRRMDWWSHGGDLPLDHYWMRDELWLKLGQGIDLLEDVRRQKLYKNY